MLSWIFASLLALACFAAVSAWLWSIGLRRLTTQQGLAGIAGMHWRDFAHIVHRALEEKRQLTMPAGALETSTEQSTDWLMQEADGRPVLVSCKHGSAYRIGEAAVNELGAKVRLSNARSGVLITEGMVSTEGRELAARQFIEVIDGRHLWPLLRDYLPAELETAATTFARNTTARHTAIALLASMTLGLAGGLGHLTSRLDDTPPPRSASLPAPAQVAATTAEASAIQTTAAPAIDPAPPALLIDGVDPSIQNPDPATLRIYQQQVSRVLSGTDGLQAAIWLTQLTLTVDRHVDDAEALALVCTVLHRYPSLRTVRVQLNPRPGVDEPVRWRQCSTI